MQQQPHQGLVIKDPTDHPMGSVGRFQVVRSKPNQGGNALVLKPQLAEWNEMGLEIIPKVKPLQQPARRMGDGISTAAPPQGIQVQGVLQGDRATQSSQAEGQEGTCRSCTKNRSR